MKFADYSALAIARFEQRHREADSLLFNSAAFVWESARHAYVVTVRDCEVLVTASLEAVRKFSDMHNGRLAPMPQYRKARA